MFFIFSLFLFVGSLFKDILDPKLSSILSFSLLFFLGVYRLFESFFKKYIKKYLNRKVPLTFKLFDFKFVLEIYANEIKADYDKSKILTPKEAFYLAVALSLDSLAIGFGSSLGSIHYLEVIILSLIIGMISSLAGVYIGKKFVEKANINLSWLSGVMLITLAFIRYIKVL